MKNSGVKKSKLQTELSHHKIQSKFLISRQINSHSSNFITKIDHLKQEEQFIKQYNLKFLTDRKRVKSNQKSQPKLSHSKLKFKQTQQRIFFQPKDLFESTNDYRKKYNELNEEYLQEKRKLVDNQKKMLNIELSLCNFLSHPNSNNAEQLINLLENRKINDFLKRIIEKSKQNDYFSNIIRQSMRILQIESSEDIIKNLRSRIQRFRNLDECTFRILELESTNKKIIQQYDEKLKKMRRQMQQRGKIQIQQYKDEIEKVYKMKHNNDEQHVHNQQIINDIVQDLNQIVRGVQKDYKIQSNLNEVIQVHEIIMNLNNKLREVEVQTQFNQFKLLQSNEEMVRLQRFMSLLKDDMSSQIQEQQQKNNQHLQQISRLQNLIEEMNSQMNTIKNQIKYLKQKINEKDEQIHDEHILLSASLGIKENSPSKIVLKIQENGRLIKELQHVINQSTEQLHEKERFIQSINKQMQNLQKNSEQIKQNVRIAFLEKQQYKFLLNNSRDQMSDLKRSHLQQKSKLVKQKDEQIIRSNKDILQSYGQAIDQLKLNKTELLKSKVYAQQQQIKSSRYEKKASQLQLIIYDKETQIKRLQFDNERYKKQLQQIEYSFKQVVQLQEMTSKKATILQAQNKQQTKLIKIHENKIKQLQKNNDQLIYSRNQLKTQANKLLYDVKELRQERIKLQSNNLEFRLDLLNKQAQITKFQEENKNLGKEMKILKVNNQKLLNDVNSITKKFIMNRIDLSKRIGKKINGLLQYFKVLKKQNKALKIIFQEQTEKCKHFILKINNEVQLALKIMQHSKQKYKEEELKNQELNNEINKYEQQIHHLKQQIQKYKDQTQKYQQKINKSDQSLSFLTQQNKKVQSLLDIMKEEHAKISQNDKLMQKQNQLLKENNKLLMKQIESMKKIEIFSKEQNQNLKINIIHLKQLRQKQILRCNQLQEEKQTINNNQMNLRQRQQILKNDFEQTKIINQSLYNQIKNIKSQGQKVKQQKQQLTKKINTLLAMSTQENYQMSIQLQTQKNQLQQKNAYLEQQLKSLQSTILLLQRQNEQQKATCIVMQRKLNEKINQNMKYEQMFKNMQQMKQQKDSLINQNQVMNNNRIQLLQQMDTKQKALQMIKQRLNAKQKEHLSHDEEIHRLKEQLLMLQSEMTKLSEQKTQKQAQLQSLKDKQLQEQNMKEQNIKKYESIQCQCFIIPSDIKEQIYLKLTNILTIISLLNGQKLQLQEQLSELNKFNIQQIYKFIFQQINIRELQENKPKNTQIDVIIEECESFQEESLVQDNSIRQESMQSKNTESDIVNNILQILLESQTEIPIVNYWEKIESNFLAIRRKIFKKPLNLKLDISSIDYKDSLGGGLHSPQSNYFIDQELTRRVGTEPDELNQARYFKEINRQQKWSCNQVQNIIKDNQELKIILNEQFQKINNLQIQKSQLKSKLVSQLNEISVKGLEYNFKKMLDYLIAENIDLFEQTCRVVMKMLQFSGNQIKDYEEKLLAKKKKKKTGILSGFFN